MSLRIRRGGFSAETPPPAPGVNYGPTAGAQTVRDGTIPRAVTQPAGTITTVNPGASWSTAITAAGINGTLWFTKGTHSRTGTVTPLAGQRWYFESAAGYTRTTADSAIVTAAGSGLGTALILGQQALEIHGGVFTGVNGTSPGAYVGALQNTAGAARPQAGWTIEDAIVTANTSVSGIHADGDNTIIRRCYVHTNGRYGLNGTAAVAGGTQYNLLVEYSRIYNNNVLHEPPTNDCGGTKWLGQRGPTIRNNWFHANYGSGIWFDGDNFNATVEENVVEDNRNWGVFWEISGGGTYIRHNLFADNGDGSGGSSYFDSPQITVSTSDATQTIKGFAPTFSSIEIQNNLTSGSSMAMFVVDTQGHVNNGVPKSRSVHFHDNDVTLTSASTERVGAGTNVVSDEIFNRDNTFEANQYHVGDTGLAYWRWTGTIAGAGAAKTWVQWQAYGHDTPGGSVD